LPPKLPAEQQSSNNAPTAEAASLTPPGVYASSSHAAAANNNNSQDASCICPPCPSGSRAVWNDDSGPVAANDANDDCCGYSCEPYNAEGRR
jgi:hypothetical protein